ncbi:hypothetical protein ACRAR1_29625 [Streptomyces sanyensis]|uniref:hypothetical protein n=1 Tax=Streptomyces sanyensis TaxID=568869 RepID=UPI003D77F139
MTNSQNPQPFLSLHTAVVLLIAFVIGTVMGVLAALAGAPVPAAVAALLRCPFCFAPIEAATGCESATNCSLLRRTLAPEGVVHVTADCDRGL